MSDIERREAETSVGEIADFGSSLPAVCTFLSLNGTRLAVESSREFPLSTTVKVTGRNQMWIGEVWVCEHVGSGFLIEIEVDARLNDVRSVAELAARFRHERTIPANPNSDPRSSGDLEKDPPK